MILGTLIEEMAGMKITFSDYPRNAAFLLELREQVNENANPPAMLGRIV